MMKTCCECKVKKDDTAFAWRHKSEGLRQSRCRECTSKRMRSKRYELNKKYRLTAEAYDLMFEGQGGLCKLCNKPESQMLHGKLKRLAVDHDRSCCPSHLRTCGKCIRGLLCSDCNRLVGRLEELGPEWLQRFKQYI